MRAIKTVYQGSTNTRGARIIATTEGDERDRHQRVRAPDPLAAFSRGSLVGTMPVKPWRVAEMNYRQQAIQELAARIKAQGYRVFIAKSGEYGFFTDADGSRVVSFQCDLGVTTFSGNYQTNDPISTGTGWRIEDHDTGDYRAMFNAAAPQWALKGAKWKYTTLEQRLKTYQASSQYTEV